MAIAVAPWIRKAAALAILVGVLLFTWLVTIAPLLEYLNAQKTALEQSGALLTRYQILIDTKSEFEERLRWYQARQNGKRFFSGPTSDLAVAGLQKQLEQIVRGNGGDIVSTGAVRTRRVGNLTRIGLHMQLTATSEAFGRIVRQIYGSPSVIRFDEVSILTPERQNGQNVPSLNVRWTAYGYYEEAG